MSSFYTQNAPWGRPVIDDLPLPPFATAADHDRFTRLLRLHVALVDDGGPSLSSKILSGALEPRGARSAQLTPLELQVAMATFFPAPWTPEAFAEVIAATQRDAPRPMADGRWNWMYDPDFTAAPRSPHGWEIERHERGTRRIETVLEHDGDLVLLWMYHFTSHHPYPYGWRVEAADLAAVAAAALSTRMVHNGDAALPYLANWRTEREAALEDPA